MASHSNARSLRNVRRNLCDDQLKALAEAGGVSGINFYHNFLHEDGTGKISQMIGHMLHIKKVAGIDALALGSDFDGFSGPCEISSADKYPKLIEAMESAGFTDDEIEKICWKNALRVISDSL